MPPWLAVVTSRRPAITSLAVWTRPQMDPPGRGVLAKYCMMDPLFHHGPSRSPLLGTLAERGVSGIACTGNRKQVIQLDETPPPLAERMQRALIEHLVRSGLLDSDDIAEICERLSRSGDDAAAREFATLMLRGMKPDPTERGADRARQQFRAIDGGRTSD
jgi:hypothetical protein